MSKELIRLTDLRMVFDDEVVLNSINLYINDQEFLTLLGPSGCGKTTTLRIIGGFQRPTSGDVFFDGVRINDVPPHKRKVNTVFQKYALFPHMNIFENVAFGLRVNKVPDPKDPKRMIKVPESEIKERVEEALALVNLAATASGRSTPSPADSSSGWPSPGHCEPAPGAAAGRAAGRSGSQAAQGHADRTQADPAAGGHHLHLRHPRPGGGPHHVRHIVVMNEGKIQQIGTPEDIYNEPKNAFVADFIGESNIIDGVMHEDYVVGMYGRKFKCLDKGFAPNEPVDVVIRPEDIDIVPEAEGQLTGTVTRSPSRVSTMTLSWTSAASSG